MDIDNKALISLKRNVREYYSIPVLNRRDRSIENYELLQELDIELGAKSNIRSERNFGIGDAAVYFLHLETGLFDFPDNYFTDEGKVFNAEHGGKIYSVFLALSDIAAYAELSFFEKSSSVSIEIHYLELPPVGKDTWSTITSFLEDNHYTIFKSAILDERKAWLNDILEIGDFMPTLRMMLFGGEDLIFDEIEYGPLK